MRDLKAMGKYNTANSLGNLLAMLVTMVLSPGALPGLKCANMEARRTSPSKALIMCSNPKEGGVMVLVTSISLRIRSSKVDSVPSS